MNEKSNYEDMLSEAIKDAVSPSGTKLAAAVVNGLQSRFTELQNMAKTQSAYWDEACARLQSYVEALLDADIISDDSNCDIQSALALWDDASLDDDDDDDPEIFFI